MPWEALRARLWRQRVAQEDGRVKRSSGLSLSTSAFSLHTQLPNLRLCMNTTYLCVCVCVQLRIHVHVIKGTDTRLVNNRKYNMNVWGVYPCFWCSLLRLIHTHNTHTHNTFSFLITFFLMNAVYYILKTLYNFFSIYACTAGRNCPVHKLQSISLCLLLKNILFLAFAFLLSTVNTRVFHRYIPC